MNDEEAVLRFARAAAVPLGLSAILIGSAVQSFRLRRFTTWPPLPRRDQWPDTIRHCLFLCVPLVLPGSSADSDSSLRIFCFVLGSLLIGFGAVDIKRRSLIGIPEQFLGGLAFLASQAPPIAR